MYQDWGSEGVRYNTYRDAGWGRGMSDQAKICISRSGSLTEQARILVERVSLDVFVGDSALLEGYPELGWRNRVFRKPHGGAEVHDRVPLTSV